MTTAEDFLGIRKGSQPTEKQLAYAHSLLRERQPYGAVADAETSSNSEAAHEVVNSMSKREISSFIDSMRLQPKRATPAPRTQTIQAEEGMYKKDGVIYKVQRAHHGSGHLYAKRLIATQTYTGPDTEPRVRVWFEYETGAIQGLRLEHRLSMEDAQAFGALYGYCCVCGRILSNEESIAAGIGPVCGGKLQ